MSDSVQPHRGQPIRGAIAFSEGTSAAAAAAKSLQSCPTLWPHRRQPTRLPCPWDSPGKNTGVGCHFLLQCMKVKSESEVAQSCPTLSDPMDGSLPGSSIHGIFQARVLEWGAMAFSRGSPQPRDRTQVSCIVSKTLYRLSHQGSPQSITIMAPNVSYLSISVPLCVPLQVTLDLIMRLALAHGTSVSRTQPEAW